MIIINSTKFRQKLKLHLEKELQLKAGDTVMFVDLGYSGTAQRLIEHAFQDEMNVEFVGRYLISLSVPGWQSKRHGLLDPSWCDDRAMRTFVTFSGLLEQLCTSNDKSVVDYDDDGNPIHSEFGLSEQQYKKLHLIQSECIRFIHDAKKFFDSTKTVIPLQTLRDAALAELGRLLFFPTELEIEFIQSFEFDLNLGTKDIFRVFDCQEGLKSLRHRGLFYSLMEKQSNAMRMNYPAELRYAGVELVLALIAQHRYGLEFGLRELNLRREYLNMVIAQTTKTSQATIEALMTHDGYFSFNVPIGDFQLGILFGQKYQWVEIDSAELINMRGFLNLLEAQFTEDGWSCLAFNQMTHKGGKLYECTADASFLAVVPPVKSDGEKYVLRIVFRPIVNRIQQTNS